jgi:hypothetical protein
MDDLIRLPLTKDELVYILISLKHFEWLVLETGEKGRLLLFIQVLELIIDTYKDSTSDINLQLSEERANFVRIGFATMMSARDIQESWLAENNPKLRDILRRLDIGEKLADHEKRIAHLEKLLQKA